MLGWGVFNSKGKGLGLVARHGRVNTGWAVLRWPFLHPFLPWVVWGLALAWLWPGAFSGQFAGLTEGDTYLTLRGLVPPSATSGGFPLLKTLAQQAAHTLPAPWFATVCQAFWHANHALSMALGAWLLWQLLPQRWVHGLAVALFTLSLHGQALATTLSPLSPSLSTTLGVIALVFSVLHHGVWHPRSSEGPQPWRTPWVVTSGLALGLLLAQLPEPAAVVASLGLGVGLFYLKRSQQSHPPLFDPTKVGVVLASTLVGVLSAQLPWLQPLLTQAPSLHALAPPLPWLQGLLQQSLSALLVFFPFCLWVPSLFAYVWQYSHSRAPKEATHKLHAKGSLPLGVQKALALGLLVLFAMGAAQGLWQPQWLSSSVLPSLGVWLVCLWLANACFAWVNNQGTWANRGNALWFATGLFLVLCGLGLSLLASQHLGEVYPGSAWPVGAFGVPSPYGWSPQSAPLALWKGVVMVPLLATMAVGFWCCALPPVGATAAVRTLWLQQRLGAFALLAALNLWVFGALVEPQWEAAVLGMPSPAPQHIIALAAPAPQQRTQSALAFLAQQAPQASLQWLAPAAFNQALAQPLVNPLATLFVVPEEAFYNQLAPAVRQTLAVKAQLRQPQWALPLQEAPLKGAGLVLQPQRVGGLAPVVLVVQQRPRVGALPAALGVGAP